MGWGGSGRVQTDAVGMSVRINVNVQQRDWLGWGWGGFGGICWFVVVQLVAGIPHLNAGGHLVHATVHDMLFQLKTCAFL